MNRVKTNVFDGLLYYVSHIGKVSWEDFKQAIRRLTTKGNPGFKAFTYLISLARLGHLDYNPMKLSHVAIAPSVLVETAIKNQYILVGSRGPCFLDEVKKCVSENGGKVQQIPEKYGPITVLLSELTEEALSTLESLGIHISREFSAKLSQILPRPRLMNIQPESFLSANLEKKFNPATLNYEPVAPTRTITDGLYQISRYGPYVYILRYGSHQRRVPRDWGEWYVLARTPGLISYQEEFQMWRVKRKLILPLLVDRCATLCSGLSPKLRNGFYCYRNVPIGIAYQLTKSLYQDWEVV